MDVYGASWDNSLGPSYKGELPFASLCLNESDTRISNNIEDRFVFKNKNLVN